jgi:hypothetical protein
MTLARPRISIVNRLFGAMCAVLALMILAPAVAIGADVQFTTYTAADTVAGGEMMNQAGGWMDALIRFLASYGFLLVIIAGFLASLWGFTIGNNKTIGIMGLVGAALGALYKGLVVFL